MLPAQANIKENDLQYNTLFEETWDEGQRAKFFIYLLFVLT